MVRADQPKKLRNLHQKKSLHPSLLTSKIFTSAEDTKLFANTYNIIMEAEEIHYLLIFSSLLIFNEFWCSHLDVDNQCKEE